MLIAGDIGGTKSWLVLLKANDNGETEVSFEKRYQSSDFSNVSALLHCFLSEASVSPESVNKAVLALPGPVKDGICRLTNLDWVVDGSELQSVTGIHHVIVMNDFAASAAGIATLTSEDLARLNQAESSSQGLRVVTGAGTGLGLAWMTWKDGAYHTNATEGGHINYAPASERQLELFKFICQASGKFYVAWEQLLSGRGLETIYQFVESLAAESRTGYSDSVDAATVSALAQDGEATAVAAVELFVEIYGSWVGNLALLYRPTGGLYIAGGIAAKMASWIQTDNFITACYNKGVMSDLVRQTPIYLVTNERLGLQGAIALVSARYNP